MTQHTISRRRFLQTGAVAGVWVLTLGRSSSWAKNHEKAPAENWCVYVAVLPDNTVSMSSPVVEMGQFMRTTGPMIIADEMDLDWSLISFSEEVPVHLHKNEQGGMDYTYAFMGAGGSFSVRRNWDYMRRAGATARQMLIEEAASRLNVEAASLETSANFVIHASSGRRLSYGELAGKAATRQVNPDSIKLKKNSQFTIIGQPKKNIDALDIVTGKPIYGIDADYPGALQAVIDRAPALGGEIASYDKMAALAVPGVRHVVEIERQEGSHWLSGETQLVSAGVAVLADNLWAAMQGRKALQTKWVNSSRYADQDSEQQIKEFHRLVRKADAPTKVERNDGDIDAAFAEADFIVDEVYEKPLLAHTCMEPFNCIADIRKDKAVIVLGDQFPNGAVETVEKMTGIPARNIEYISKRLGGGFGRRAEGDYLKEAVILSQKVKRPVKVTWMREDEIEHDFFGPAVVMRIRAGVKDGKLIGWHHKQAQSKGGSQLGCFPSEIVKNYRVEHCLYESHLRAGAWRGPMHLQWAFAAESMMDEVAHKLNIDPLAFRLELMKPHQVYKFGGWGADEIDSGRMAKVYEDAARLADWGNKRSQGTGLGIAAHFTHGTYAAFVIEVSVDKSRRLSLNRAWGAIDCGIAINPNHIRHQMEGGFIDGLNAALFNKANIKNGQVQNNNFDTLHFIRMNEAPLEVETVIIESDREPTGVGEPPTAPAAGALANAIFAATGERIRRMPFSDSIRIHRG